MADTVTSLAEEIFCELGEPATVSSFSIELWIRNNIGRTRTFLGKTYELVDTGDVNEFSPSLDGGSKAFLKLDYTLYFYNLLLNSLLGAAGYEVQVVESDGAMVRTVDKNQLSKTYSDVLKTLREERKDLINFYRNDNHAIKKVYSEDAYYSELNNRLLTFNRNLL